MRSDFYIQGQNAALHKLRFEKTALRLPFRRLIPQITQRLNRSGTNIENSVYKHLPSTKPYLAGVPSLVLKETAIGAALGGALGAPLGAMAAEPGERAQGALSGLASGAGQGALWGGLSAGIRGPIANVARNRLIELGKQKGLSTSAARQKALAEYDKRSWTGNVKDIFTGAGALGRKGSAIAAGGGTAGLLIGDLYVPSKVDEAINPENRITTAAAKAKKDDSGIPPTMLGSYVGGMGTNIGTRLLLRNKRFPFQRKLGPAALEIVPIVATTGGAATGYLTAKKLKKYKDSESTKKAR